jgi:hypothetical protein
MALNLEQDIPSYVRPKETEGKFESSGNGAEVVCNAASHTAPRCRAGDNHSSKLT